MWFVEVVLLGVVLELFVGKWEIGYLLLVVCG